MESLLLAVDGLEASTVHFCSGLFRDPIMQKTAVDQLLIINDQLALIALRLRDAANTIAPPNRLPPELLRAIFSHLRPDTHRDWTCSITSPYADLCAASRVCRRWREIAISASELWTYIVLTDTPEEPEMDEKLMAQLCMLRAGARPLDLLYTNPLSHLLNDGGLIPDRRRVRSLVFVYDYEDSYEELADFLPTVPDIERLEVVGAELSWMTWDGPEIALPRLRELAISRCNPWSNHKFGSLTSLSLLCQEGIDAEINYILDTLRCSPLLEEFVLERARLSKVQDPLPPERDVTMVPLHSLRKFHVCRLMDKTTRILLGMLDLPPRGMFMRFTDVSKDFGSILEKLKPSISPLTATKLELIYPPEHGIIIHATDGATYTRLAHRKVVGHSRLLDRIWDRPPGYPLKEFWLRIDRDVGGAGEIPLPRGSCGLETLVVDTTDENVGLMLHLWLSPQEGAVPFPLLSTIELWSAPGVVGLEDVLKVRSDAGHRLRTVRIRWYAGCEARVARLEGFVDRVDIYHVDGRARGGMELPEECMTRGRWWGPWDQSFTEGVESEPPEDVHFW